MSNKKKLYIGVIIVNFLFFFKLSIFIYKYIRQYYYYGIITILQYLKKLFSYYTCFCKFLRARAKREHDAEYLVFGISVGTEGQQRGNSLGSSLPGCHVEVGGEWILKVALLERRQLPDELRHTDVFEVNDLADGLLVVGILVQPVARVNAYSKFVYPGSACCQGRRSRRQTHTKSGVDCRPHPL